MHGFQPRVTTDLPNCTCMKMCMRQQERCPNLATLQGPPLKNKFMITKTVFPCKTIKIGMLKTLHFRGTFMKN